MKNDQSVLDPSIQSLFYTAPKQETYKGFRLISNLMHLGMGGSIWLTSVVTLNNVAIASFSDDSFLLQMAEAKEWIDDVTSAIGV